MTFVGYLIVFILIAAELFDILLEKFNDRFISKVSYKPTSGLLEIYTKEELEKSAEYHEEKSGLDFYDNVTQSLIFFFLLIAGLFQSFSYILVNNYSSEYLMALIFFFCYQLMFALIALPFDVYETFVIEKKYNFNKTTPSLFVRDLIIGSVISFVVFVIVLFTVIFLINTAGRFWYLYAAAIVFSFSVLMMYIYPTLIAPIFNKFEPLENKELEEKIFRLAEKADFPVKNIMQMDASKRSGHSNAYFTGFGRSKRIVLFDTLLENHSDNEILNILAHEIAHYKLGHLRKMLIFMFISTVVSFYVVGLLINNSFIYEALGFEKAVFSGLFIISIILGPAGKIFSPVFSYISRKHEYEADYFAVKLTGEKDIMKNTLIKLHKDNLSFPTAHPFYVKMHYSHPPLPERIASLEKINVYQ